MEYFNACFIKNFTSSGKEFSESTLCIYNNPTYIETENVKLDVLAEHFATYRMTIHILLHLFQQSNIKQIIILD